MTRSLRPTSSSDIQLMEVINLLTLTSVLTQWDLNIMTQWIHSILRFRANYTSWRYLCCETRTNIYESTQSHKKLIIFTFRTSLRLVKLLRSSQMLLSASLVHLMNWKYFFFFLHTLGCISVSLFSLQVHYYLLCFSQTEQEIQCVRFHNI